MATTLSPSLSPSLSPTPSRTPSPTLNRPFTSAVLCDSYGSSAYSTIFGVSATTGLTVRSQAAPSYISDSYCTLQISAPSNMRVRFTFTDLTMDQGFDFVRFYDGFSTYATATLFATFWGSSLPAPIVSPSNKLTVRPAPLRERRRE